MRKEEARLMAEWVRSLALPAGSVCLNVGSSTAEFRKVVQPHIDRLLIGPIEEAGIRVVHCDMKPAAGVDEVGDLLDPGFRERLRAYCADVMLCSNLLEHLTDPVDFLAACGDLVRPGGYGLVTMPLSYPYHADPIDTMLRLKPDEIAALLPGWEVVRAEELVAGSHANDLRGEKRPLVTLAKQLGRTAMPFYRSHQWRGIAHRLLWLFRPYRQSMVLLRKPA
jgi:SAM-dependent methyltransferase